VNCALFVAVYLVFAFQRGPETDSARDAASSRVAGAETSRKRKLDDCDKPVVESGTSA